MSLDKLNILFFTDSPEDYNSSKAENKSPRILEISTHENGIQIYGHVYKYSFNTKSWKKVVMILKDSVLYELGGLEDKIAKSDTVIMGYELDLDYKVRNTPFIYNYTYTPCHKYAHTS